MKTSISDYLFSPLVWIQIIILFLLLTLLALIITPLGPLLGAWAGNTFVTGLTIEGVSGSLLTQLKVEKLVWEDGDITTLKGIDIEPGRPDFSKNLVIIDSLSIDSITIDLEEGTPDRKRGELVNIGDFGIAPINLFIASGKLDEFTITSGIDSLFQLKNIGLNGTTVQDDQLSLTNVQTTMVLPDQLPMDVTMAGMTMDMLAPHALELDAGFRWQYPEIGLATVGVKGSGLLQKYQLAATGDIIHPEYGAQYLSLKGTGNFDFLDIDQLILKGVDGQMSAQGELAWVPALSTDLTIEADKLQTAQFMPEWPAEITGKFSLVGNIEQEKLRGELDIDTLTGSLRGFPISGSGKMSMLNQELIFDKLQLRSANNTIKVDGRGTEPFDLSWNVDGKDISTLAPGLTGRINAKGTLTGSLEQPVLNGSMNAVRFSFQGNKVDSTDLEVSTNNGQFQLSAKASGVVIAGERLSGVTLRGKGDIKNHSIAFTANHPEAKIAASVTGEWDAGVWRSKVEKLSINNPSLGRWHLKSPANIIASTNSVKADELCLISSNGSACSALNYSPQSGFETVGKLENTPLGLMNPFLPEGLAVKGRVDGEYKVSLDPDLKGAADLHFSSGELKLTQDGKIQRFNYRKGSVKADIDGNNLQSDINFLLSEQGSIAATAAVKLSPSDGKHIIDAKGKFEKVPLGLAQTFLPEGMNLTGQASGSFDLKQTAAGRIGKVSLTSGDTRFFRDENGDRQRYDFDKVDVDATIDNDNVIAAASLSIRGGGRFNTRATADLGQASLVGSIEAEGQIKDMPLALARPYLPKNIALDGLLSGDYKVNQQTGKPVGQVDFIARDGFFAHQANKGKPQRYRYQSAKIKGSIDGDKVVADIDLALREGGSLTTRATIDLANKDLINAVEVAGQVKDLPLALARPYLPEAFDVDGLISGQYQVQQGAAGPIGKIDLLAREGLFSYKQPKGKRDTYRYRQIKLQGSIEGDKAIADVALELKSGGVLTSKFNGLVSSFDKKPIFKAEGSLEALPLELVQAYLPKELATKGSASGRYQVEQNGSLKGKVELSVPNSVVKYDDGKLGEQRYQFSRADILADINGDAINTDLNFVLREGGAFSTKGRLDLAQANNLYGFEGEGALKAFPLALIQPYIPAKVVLKGVVDGNYQLTQRGGQQGNVQLKLPASSLTFIDEKGESQTFDYKSVDVNATVKGKKVIGDALIVMRDGGAINAKGNITLGKSAKAHTINLQGELQSVPLALLKPYLPKDFKFPGKVSGSYMLRQRGGNLSGDVGLSLPNSYFIVQTASGDKQSFAYQNGVLNAKVDGDRINVDASLAFKGRGDFRSRAQIILRKKGSPSINGSAEVNIPNIYWAQSYVPYSRGLRGAVVGSVRFSGLASKPSVTGQISMSNGYVRLPQVGTELSNISLQIQANKANQATISGTMNSGGGVLRANGSLALNDIKNWSARMSLDGDNIKFVDTHEAVAFMTPNLQINANPKAVVITGTVDIPKADINLKDLPEFSIDESDDVIVIGEVVPGEAIKAVRMQPNILVRLGNEVNFNGFGFSSRLVGGIRVTNSRNTIVTNGSLNIVNGRYQAYGQDLRIANGRLVFNGVPKNVGVDVRAVRPVEDVGTVGIHLTGTIQKLKSTIFSDPPMQETDALSYLLTGQSLTSASGRETALLMQAVRGLGIDGSNGLVQRIGKSLGLDDLSIVTREDFRDSELQLGKRLGSKLYVRYLVGLFDSAHRLAVEYRVNKYLNFEVQAGVDEQSVDLIYEYEKD